jgi:S1-C subfamily serine protease
VLVAVALVVVIGATVAGGVWLVAGGLTPKDSDSQPEPPAVTVTETAPPDALEASETPEPPAPSEPAVPSEPSEQTEDFAATYQDVESGVVRILATTCEGDGIGSGFLIDRRTVATAAHVINGAEGVAVDSATGTHAARVVGIDPATDLALLRLDAPVAGHVFEFAATNALPGTEVAAIGFPLDEPKTLTIGTVSGLDRTIEIEGESRSGLLQTDTAINPGNSGGPLVTIEGEVVGVVDALRLDSQGIGYAVQVSVAEPVLIDQVGMQTPAVADCGYSEAPAQLSVVPRLLPPPGPASSRVRRTLSAYYNGINSADYERVIDQLSASFGAGFSADRMARDLATSFDFSVVIHEVSGSTTQAQAWVTFVSVQAPRFGPDGESCTEWSLDYTFTGSGDRLLIDGVQARSGDGNNAC